MLFVSARSEISLGNVSMYLSAASDGAVIDSVLPSGMFPSFSAMLLKLHFQMSNFTGQNIET